MRALIKQKQAYEDQQKEIRRLEDMIRRFEHWAHIVDNPRHARQARNKQKFLDRMDKIDRPTLDGGKIDPRFTIDQRQGRIALEIRNCTVGYPGQAPLLDRVGLDLAYGDRVALIGANGTGKSTLFKRIVTEAAWENTTLRIGPRTRVGYYAQEHETLNFDRSVLEEIQLAGNFSRDSAFTVLSRFLFEWRDMDRKISELSGGEKSRVQLAKLSVMNVNLLLLDEPTNHLDVHARERVEEALEAFERTLFVISHDRYFLDRIVDRIVEIQPPHFVEFAGNFSAYWERHRTDRPGQDRQLPSDVDGRTDEVERQVDALEAERLILESQLVEAFRKANYRRGEQLSRKVRLIEERIDSLVAQI